MGYILRGDDGAYRRATVGAVLLAAGAGSRLGGRPKALLELDGVPLIRRQVDALSGAGIDEVAVVLGHHADAVATALHRLPVTLAYNPRPDCGQPCSVRIGLQSLSTRHAAVVVALADQPLIGAEDVIALIDAFRRRGDASMVVPIVCADGDRSEPGNPVVVDAALRDEWLAGPIDIAGRRWRLAHPDRVLWLTTANRNYRTDIDTPDDIERFVAATGRALTWPVGLEHACAT